MATLSRRPAELPEVQTPFRWSCRKGVIVEESNASGSSSDTHVQVARQGDAARVDNAQNRLRHLNQAIIRWIVNQLRCRLTATSAWRWHSERARCIRSRAPEGRAPR